MREAGLLSRNGILKTLFEPRSIAVIGVSKTPGKMGYEILTNLVKYGFPGPIFPVNPKYAEIHDIRCYKTVLDVTEDIDLAILVTPVERIPKIMGELGAKGVKVAVVISGKRGDPSSYEIYESAQKHGIRILGPSSMGIFHVKSRLNATLGPMEVLEGGVGLVTESRTLGMALMGLATVQGVGLSAVIGLGDKLDVGEREVLNYLVEDRSTKSLVLHIESVKDSDSLRDIIAEVARRKPLVVLTASDRVKEELKNLRDNLPITDDVITALDMALALSGKRIRGRSFIAVTNSGGAGKLLKGIASDSVLDLPKPGDDLIEEMRQFVPEGGDFSSNPVDITGRAGTDVYRGVLDVLMSRGDVDGVIALHCETALSDPMRFASMISDLWDLYDKPLIPVIMGGRRASEAVLTLRRRGIPAYPTPCRALRSADSLVRWSLFSTS